MSSISEGDIKTVWRISLPLILSFLSMMGMMTVDRLFLARYSVEALSAAVTGGAAAWALILGGQTLTSISGVFVAQLNGAKKEQEVGKPIWQMIWLSLLLMIPFCLAAVWFAPWIFSGSPIAGDQILYYRWMMGLSLLLCLVGALNGFYIGLGRASLITWLTLLGNTINMVLDPLLIFGWFGFPRMGISGACLATGIGLFVQCSILFYIFIKKGNRDQFGTANIAVYPKLLKEMCRVGSPEALSISLEIGAWAVFYFLLSNLSVVHILVVSVGQSILLSFLFFGLGMEQGIASVCGNLIGANLKDEVVRAFRSGLMIVGAFGAVILASLWLGGEQIVSFFLDSPERGGDFSSITPEGLMEARSYVLQSCIIIGIYIILENIRCLLYGVLRAAGDTFFILVISVVTTWAMLIIPTYVLMTLWEMPVYVAFWIWISFAFWSTALCYIRFALGSWRTKEIYT